MSLENVLSRLDRDLDKSLDRLFALLRYPSIGADSAFDKDTRACAEHIVADLKTMGFDAAARETGGHPCVVGHRRRPGKPHILFYGHYDVQPVDPLDLWETPPFEPRFAEIEPGRKAIVARGACDDKGQVMTFLEACRAMIAETGDLPISLTVMIEGEEESTSVNLERFVAANKAELAADICLICDTGMWDQNTPQITSSLRGILFDEVIVRAANRDLHSGLYGGTAQNPIHILTRIVASLHGPDGRIAVPDFYVGVHETGDNRKAAWNALGLTEADFLGPIGLKHAIGEKDRSLIEKMQARPTCDCNGIWGGYTGEGTKTVIPSEARAKISFRLVHDQDPEAIRANFRRFVKAQIPEDCTVEFITHGGSRALQLREDSPELIKSMKALKEEWGNESVILGTGGSIPVGGSFKTALGFDPLFIGFGLEDDKVHSPNEKYDVRCFHKGQRSWARIIMALGA